MNKINWKVRFKNPMFLFQLFLSLFAPVMAFLGFSWSDITTWSALGEIVSEAIRNPYVLGLTVVSLFNALNDPTTKGLSDSDQALNYKVPKK